ncbi:MAG TPA: acetate/propionate family kinase [Candidatus Saccharimonadales bacterium]|nr:acetate/propionate family kinase [Candidatus Saccharimonadales bacterium]
MSSSDTHILTVNAGSSSIKLALFTADNATQKVLEVTIEDIGQSPASFVTAEDTKPVNAGNHSDATKLLTEWLAAQVAATSIVAVGHRIVHGGPDYHEALPATAEVLADLRKLIAFDPQHLPIELELVTVFQDALPHAEQVLCFDTAFHHHLPTISRLLPIPRHFETKGLRRYGFHGLSYAYILEELRQGEGEMAANGKVIIAHLGSGASLAALQNSKTVDTTMSITPASGIPMSTRSGDLDPGLALYFAHTEGYDAERFNHMVNFESGLLGISETTADMKKLLEIEAEDERAKDAVDIFCYQTRKSIGSLTAALGGLNTLVFTGGMGENAPKIRDRICKGLEFLGITIDDSRNQQGNRLISADGSQVGVHVIHTDEAITIARETVRLIKQRGSL